MEYFVTLYTTEKRMSIYIGRSDWVSDPIYEPIKENIVIKAFFEMYYEGYVINIYDQNGKVINTVENK